MTRGQIAIILPDGEFLCTVDFNGSMNFSGYGREIVDELDCMENEKEFTDFIEQFNSENFSYDEELLYKYPANFTDFSDERIANMFSEYLYLKNLSENPVIFTDKNGKKIEIDTDMVAVFKYGEFLAGYDEDFDRVEFIEKLNELREGLSYNMEENYANLWNVCADFDNNHHGSYITDRIQEYDFVDDEVLDYILVEQSKNGLSRLRCFIGDTYDDRIYRLDGYGNLANVDNSDFECLIDEISEEIESDITVPLAKQEAYL